MSNILCIYHANCADGFTAAWIVKNAVKNVEFHAGTYGEAPPDCTGKKVLMVDFSYKRDVLLSIAEQADSVLILDHHETAEAELVDLPDNVTAIFDMERSGAMITWDYFHRKTPAPLLVKHVQDRDLYQFLIPHTEAFMANVYSYEYTFENWDDINNVTKTNELYKAFIAEGEAIQRCQDKQVRELIAANKDTALIDGHLVPTLNAPYFFSSSAGHIMAKDAPFAACYCDTPNGRVFSLRSSKDGLNVAEIAAKFGGGGHKHAAGFTVDRESFGFKQ